MVYQSQFGGGRRSVGRRRGGFRWQIMLLFAVGAAVYYFSNQEEVPFTGRKQLRTMDAQQEIQLGLQSYYTAVYTGLIPIAENEDGLAVVMGHEIGHALAHHGAERMAQQNMQRIVGAGVSMGAGGMDYGAQRAVMGVFGGISQYGYALPFSRKHESESDYIGLILMARACYDPREAPRLWERMGAAGGQTPPEFQSTHPSPETRVSDFKAWMPEAIDVYNQSCPNKIR